MACMVANCACTLSKPHPLNFTLMNQIGKILSRRTRDQIGMAQSRY